MHRDKKIGFALGILLVGIVAAFFFRNEPDPFAELPPLEDPAALDSQIAENPISPYTEDGDASQSAERRPPEKSQWELPEIYRPREEPRSEDGLPSAAAAPAPINLEEPIPEEPAGPQNEIDVQNPFADRPVESKESFQPLPGNEAWTTGLESSEPKKKPKETTKEPGEEPVEKRDDVAEKPNPQPTIYRIRQGDTLSVLAEKHLGSSRRYMEIFEANRDKLESPDDIQIGMRIRIPSRVSFSGEGKQKQTDNPPASGKQPNQSPSRKEAGRFRPFSRSPLGPARN